MERKTNLKQVKNCSEDPRFLKLKLFQIIGCIKNICIGSFFNVGVINALFEVLFVLRYSNSTFASVRRLFTIKNDVGFPLYKF